MAAGLIVAFIGYSVGSYGYVLVRGWNIPVKQWFDPLDPWQWPSGSVPTVPAGQIFPGTGSAAAGTQPGIAAGVGNAALNLPQAVTGPQTGRVGLSSQRQSNTA